MSQPPMALSRMIAYRIRIGVTGHRELPDQEQMETLVSSAKKDILQYLCKENARRRIEANREGDPKLVYEVVSPLAEGADQLVAIVLTSPQHGALLNAVIPLTDDDYRATFKSDESRGKFGMMLALCPSPVRLRSVDLAQESSDPARQRELRHQAYEDAGRYVVDHCDVLFALWNGNATAGPGGTAEIVEYARMSDRPVVVLWLGRSRLLNPDARIDASTFEGLRRFNLTQLGAGEWERRKARFAKIFFAGPSAECIPSQVRDTLTDWLLPYYARASFLAGRSQSQFFRLGNFVYTLSALAMGCVAIAVLVDSVSTIGFGLELVLLATIAAAVFLSRELAPSATWMESRLLTERLRCAGFLALCGLDATPLKVLPFMAHAHGERAWMVIACEEICERRPIISALPNLSCLKEYIRVAWIEAQIDFHRRTREREEEARRRLETVAAILLACTIGVAALHLAWSVLPEAVKSHHWIHKTLTMVSILFPAVMAALIGIQVTREHLRLAKRSQSFGHRLGLLGLRLEKVRTDEGFLNLLKEVDEVMLRESQDWLMLMRHVEIKTG